MLTPVKWEDEIANDLHRLHDEHDDVFHFFLSLVYHKYDSVRDRGHGEKGASDAADGRRSSSAPDEASDDHRHADYFPGDRDSQ